MPGNNDLITVSQVARILEVDPTTVYRWWRAGRLPQPVVTIGWTKWRRMDILRWKEAIQKPTAEAMK